MSKMKILIVGSGGREHALAWALLQSEPTIELFFCPGNGGTAQIGKNIEIDVDNISAITNFAKNNSIDLVIAGSEVPLVLGLIDELTNVGVKAFGPTKAAAQLEGSKAYAKHIMQKYKIPTAEYKEFTSQKEAIDYLEHKQGKLVIKADGLASGKGVIICENNAEAKKAVERILIQQEFGKAGNKIIIEDFLEGEEASFLAFCDGKTAIPMVSSQDHKKIYDEDKGPNTGGMGAYSPAPVVTKEIEEKTMQKIILPILRAMEKEGAPFKGVLYAGLMIKNGEPTVVEFNTRFGDPETQAILPRLKSNLLKIMLACINGTLSEQKIEWNNQSCTCVVIASKGYPKEYEKGKEIFGIEKIQNAFVFHAATKFENGKLLSNGGRVLGISSLGNTIAESITNAYNAVGEISMENAHYRTDIGKKALIQKV